VIAMSFHLLTCWQSSTKLTSDGLYITLRLYDVKNAIPTGFPKHFQLEVKDMEDVPVVVDKRLDLTAKKGRNLKLAILKPFQESSYKSKDITRLVEDSNGEDRVEHAAVLLEQESESSRMYTKLNTGGVIWVSSPKNWNQPRELYVSSY
jgi:hypothetical protein